MPGDLVDRGDGGRGGLRVIAVSIEDVQHRFEADFLATESRDGVQRPPPNLIVAPLRRVQKPDDRLFDADNFGRRNPETAAVQPAKLLEAPFRPVGVTRCQLGLEIFDVGSAEQNAAGRRQCWEPREGTSGGLTVTRDQNHRYCSRAGSNQAKLDH